MTATSQIVEGVWQLNLGAVNAFLIADADRQGESTLIDTGTPNSEGKIVAGIESIGKKVTDLKHIVVTHGGARFRRRGVRTWRPDQKRSVAEVPRDIRLKNHECGFAARAKITK